MTLVMRVCYLGRREREGRKKKLVYIEQYVLLYVHQKRENFSPSLFFTLFQGSNPPLTNFFTYPHCFVTAFTSDVTSQLNSRERGGASD